MKQETKNAHRDSRAGQSLLEVLIATVVGAVMILATITLIGPALKSNVDVVKIQTSSALAKEMMDQVRVFAEADWHNLRFLATSSANLYYLAAGRSPFVTATGTESVIVSDASGLVGHWKLDEATGTTAFDSSAYGNDGAYSVALSATTTCTFGTCHNMASRYVNLGSSSTLNLTGDMSIMAWINIRAATFPNGGTNWIIMNNEVFQASGFIYRVDGAALKPYLRTNQAGTYTHSYANTALASSTWYHVGITKSGGTVTFYKDGVADGIVTTYSNPVTATNPLTISANSQGMDGLMDDVRLYNRALSATEVANLYKGTAFTRAFYVDDVARNVSGYIQGGGSTPDPSTKKITVIYGWKGGSTTTMTSYVGRSKNRVYYQTDWSGGANYSGPTTSTENRFSTSSNISTTSTGSIQIIL